MNRDEWYNRIISRYNFIMHQLNDLYYDSTMNGGDKRNHLVYVECDIYNFEVSIRNFFANYPTAMVTTQAQFSFMLEEVKKNREKVSNQIQKEGYLV